MQKLISDRRLLVPVLLTAVVIAVGSALIVLLSGDASGGSSSAASGDAGTASTASSVTGAPVTVDIAEFKFAPPALSVKAGTKVTWVNHDVAPHTATASGVFDTGTLQKNDKKTLTLAKPGTYDYVCQFHPFMHGTITVK